MLDLSEEASILPSPIDMQNKSTRKRILIKKVIPKTDQTSVLTSSIETKTLPSKRRVLKTRRVHKTISVEPITLTHTLIDTIVLMPTLTRLRTYTYVVTRVHDTESIVMSSTSVKPHTYIGTETITRTNFSYEIVPVSTAPASLQDSSIESISPTSSTSFITISSQFYTLNIH